MTLLRLASLALLCALPAPAVWAQQPRIADAVAAMPAASPGAGMVKRLSGVASVERAGVRTPVTPGLSVQVGDTLRTGADSALGITLADDTLLTLGANSELVITEFAFDGTTQDGNLLASLWRGTLGVVTGLIGKKAPEKVQVQTRTVVLGVRGTEFIVDAGMGPS